MMLYDFQHWIRLDMQPDVLVHSLKMTVDPSDSSYMPSLVVMSGGDSFTAMNELATVNIRNTDTVVLLLSDVKEVRLPLLLRNIPLRLQDKNILYHFVWNHCHLLQFPESP